jgi:hypothetical protein
MSPRGRMWQRNWRLDSRYCARRFHKFRTATRPIRFSSGKIYLSVNGLWVLNGWARTIGTEKMRSRTPFGARLMRCYQLSTRINYVANDDEKCSAPVELAETQSRLFS